MISLRQHIDNFKSRPEHKPAAKTSTPVAVSIELSDLDEASLAAFRSALLAMGECGQRAVPSVGKGLVRKLADINKSLECAATADSLNKASEEMRAELSSWAECALRHHNENEREIKEIMGVVTRAAEAIGSRDEKYSHEIGDLTVKMRSITDMKDLAAIRTSIIDSTTVLKSCVEKMVEDGKMSMRHLNAEVQEYRSRLEESERIAALDPLTRLANRRAFESELQVHTSKGTEFSLILIDLNDFKCVNDQNGHLAGDDLLRQFAAELRTQLTPTDMVCRWGGDEFAVITPGSAREASDRVDRINRWVLGEYKITNGSLTVKTEVKASVGVVQWDGKETGLELVARADLALYRSKDTTKTVAKENPGRAAGIAIEHSRSRPVAV